MSGSDDPEPPTKEVLLESPPGVDLMLDAHTLGLDDDRAYPGTVQELLSAAADSIERFGHNKRAMGNTTYGFCVHGAFDHAIWNVGRGERFSADVIREAIGRLCRSIGTRSTIAWNDAPERTGHEVVVAMRAAAQWQPPQEQAEQP